MKTQSIRNVTTRSLALSTWFLTSLVLGWLAITPVSRAVTPAPDGGYPGFNTAEGTDALFNLTTGVWNTALGGRALYHNTTGSSNTAVGTSALFQNNGTQNVALGVSAVQNNTTGSQNTGVGYQSLYYNNTGFSNSAFGYRSLLSNSSGRYNTAVGQGTLLNTTGGDHNIALGAVQVGTFNHVGAGSFNTTESNTICIGHPGGLGSGTIAIGESGFFTQGGFIPVHTRTFIAGIRGVATGMTDALPVVIDSAGQLGTMSSSKRFKKDIEPMAQSSEAILSLKPVTFHYQSDGTNTRQFGLIAEEVAAVNPDLTMRDQKGKIYTVRYDAVNAMLLNEFLKQHDKVQEQETAITQLRSTIAQQQKEIEALTQGLQKVSARLELAKPEPRNVITRR